MSTPNKRNIIDYFLNFGIFSISDRINFSHKLFKEFCAAYYITNSLTVSSDTELLEKLSIMKNGERWLFLSLDYFQPLKNRINF